MVTLLLLLLAAQVGGSSQGATARLHGRVSDPSGAVLAGATIVITDGVGQVRLLSTDRKGTYAIDRLAPGTIGVLASAPGFADAQRSVDVAAGQDPTVDLTLAIAIQRQTVTVEAGAASATDPAANANAIVLKGKDLDALSDDPAELEAQLHALGGAAAGPTGPHIYIDGFTGGKLPPKSAILEIRVNQNGYSAEYDAPGLARVEVVTKPGGRSFHGRFLADASLRDLSSRNPFMTEPPAYRAHSLTATLEGPVGPKASFSLTVDRTEIDDASAVAAVGLDAALNLSAIRQAVPNAHRTLLVNSRADAQLSSRDTLSIRYRFYGLTDDATGVGQFALPSQAVDASRTEHDIQISSAHVFGKRAMNEVHLELRRQAIGQAAVDGSPQLVVTGAFIAGGNPIGTARTSLDHLELFDTLSTARGAHLLKAGGRLRVNAATDSSRQNFNGTFTFSSLDAYRATELGLQQGWTPEAIRQAGGGASQFVMAAGQPVVAQTMTDLGLFVEDDVRVASRVTIGAGLRYEFQTGMAGRGDLAPRGSVAWGLGRATKAGAPPWVLRAGAGGFYDRVPQTLFLQALRLDEARTRQFVVAAPDFYPLVPSAAALAASDVRSTPYLLGRSVAPPRMIQTGATIERRIAPGSTAALGYLYSRGSRQLYSRNIAASAQPEPQPPIYAFESGGRFDEHQVTANLTVRSGARVSLGASYVFSDAHGDTSGATSFPSNPADLRADYGRMPFDVRHRLTLFMGINGPGFRVVPTIFANSGQPFDITVGRDLNGDSIFNDRPAFASDPSRASVVQTPLGAFDTAPGPDARIIPRNYGTGPAQIMASVRVMKPFVVHQHDTLRVDVLVINLLNRANLAQPVGSLSSPLFGTSTGLAAGGASSANRQIRLQLQFIF